MCWLCIPRLSDGDKCFGGMTFNIPGAPHFVMEINISWQFVEAFSFDKLFRQIKLNVADILRLFDVIILRSHCRQD